MPPSRQAYSLSLLPANYSIYHPSDPKADSKALFNQAKRRVLSILKVHHGSDLEAVLVKPVSAEDEDTWAGIVEEERQEERRQVREQRHTAVPRLNDIRSSVLSSPFGFLALLTLIDLQSHLYTTQATNLAGRPQITTSWSRRSGRQVPSSSECYRYRHPSQTWVVSHFSLPLSLIRAPPTDPDHRRLQRQHELSTLRDTLTSLREKKGYVQDQISSYHVYIDQSMSSIQKKRCDSSFLHSAPPAPNLTAPPLRSKRRLVLPWSLQAHHQRDLEKAGKSYLFGSYKYSAQTLYDRGILLSVDQYSPKQFDKISLTISSNEVGVFEVSASYLGLSVADVVLTLEDLLDKQFVSFVALVCREGRI